MKYITTEELANLAGVKAESVRARVCRTGEYFGLRPERLVNRRLLWPADSIERLKLNHGKRKAA